MLRFSFRSSRRRLRLPFLLLLCSSCAIGGLLLLACGDDETPVTPADGGVVRDSQFPSESRPDDPLPEAGADGSHFCKGRIDTANARCDDFDEGPTEISSRGWTVTSSQDGGGGRFGPRLITDGAAPSSPHALDMTADPVSPLPRPDAGGDGGDGGNTGPIITDVLPKSIITDVVTVDKLRSTLEADIFVAEAPSNSQYRILRFDFGPTPDDLTGLTFDVMTDGKWRCVGYGLQALGKELKKGVWQHVRLVMYSTGSNLKAYCEVGDIKTGEINGQPTSSTARRLEIGVTTYATNTPRTRILYDNIDFHAE
jgi:hypothetical protein